MYTCHGAYLVIDTRNQDLASGRYKLAHYGEKIRHGFVHGATKDTGMQVACGTANSQVEVGYTAQTIGQAGLCSAEPVVIRDTDGVDILKVVGCFAVDDLLETLRARLFHAFEAEFEVHRQLQAQLDVRLDYVDPA